MPLTATMELRSNLHALAWPPNSARHRLTCRTWPFDTINNSKALMPMHLKIAIADHPHTTVIRNGQIPIEGVEAEFVTVKPQIGALRRMIVSELFVDPCT